ncbi:MAG TPA: hypothetical protein PKE47_12055 [Verrucomicrobiota bacterium]|nr:hypothetical protein [Verrucomicrobiota bacterium]
MTQGLAACLESPDADVGRGASELVLEKFAEAARTWSQSVTELAVWQDEHLLNAPREAALARNLEAIRHLLRLGRLLGRVAEDEQFEDEATRRMVAATMNTLRDMERLWASPRRPAAEADALLERAFPHVA